MTADISTREGLFAVMRQIAAEREAAKPLVAELLAREQIPWDEDVPQEWKTIGFVQELTKAAADGLLNSGPEKHISLLQFTVAVLSSIPVDAYPPTVRAKALGTVWTELGWGHRYQSSYAEALRAYRSAHCAVEPYGELTYEKNTLLYLESQVFGQMREIDRAINMLENARAVYTEFGDKRRLMRCDIMKSAFLEWKGDVESSYAVVAKLVAAIQDVEDAHTKGVIYDNFGLLNLRLGRLTEAETAYEQARRIYSVAGMPVEIIRSDWGIASVQFERGDFAGALGKLNEIRSGFLDHQLVDDAGLTGLDIVEVLVAMGRSDEARALAEQVLQEFRTANLNVRAMHAAAYLRDLLSDEKRARNAVRHARAERMQLQETEIVLPLPNDPD